MFIKSYDESGNQKDYSCKYQIQTTYNGKTWFGDSTGLILPGLVNTQPLEKYKENHLIKITFSMNVKLTENVDLIEIYDSDWDRLGFSNSNGSIIDGQWSWSGILSGELANKANEKLTVIFLKNNENSYRPNKIYAMEITVKLK